MHKPRLRTGILPPLRHDKGLYGEISRLIYRLLRDFVAEAAGRPLSTAGILLRFHPHWHGLFLEGGFDHENRFVHVPKIDLQKMSCCFRQRVIAFFLERTLLNARLARNMLVTVKTTAPRVSSSTAFVSARSGQSTRFEVQQGILGNAPRQQESIVGWIFTVG
jgi:hypothetical protein